MKTLCASFEMRTTSFLLRSAIAGCALLCTQALGQVLETETSRLLPAHRWEVGAALEYQTSSDGTEAAVPLVLLYGISDDVEIAVEPVPYTGIYPKAGSRAVGFGDTEVTLTYRFCAEGPAIPAFALAAEAKIPTARNDRIGTGELDYTAYLIASKRFGDLDVHANLSFTLVGQPSGTSLNNTIGFNLAGIYKLDPKYSLFAEVLTNSSASGSSGESSQGSIVPEAAGSEIVGTAGVGKNLGGGLFMYLGFSDDNNGAFQAKTGFTFSF